MGAARRRPLLTHPLVASSKNLWRNVRAPSARFATVSAVFERVGGRHEQKPQCSELKASTAALAAGSDNGCYPVGRLVVDGR